MLATKYRGPDLMSVVVEYERIHDFLRARSFELNRGICHLRSGDLKLDSDRSLILQVKYKNYVRESSIRIFCFPNEIAGNPSGLPPRKMIESH